MPGAPEELGAVVVAGAADHVLGGVDAVDERPEAEHAPGEEKFQPDDVELEEGEETELGGGVAAPVGVDEADDADVVEVQDGLHGE